MRQTLRASGPEKIDAPPGEQQTCGAAEHGQQQALAKQLADDQGTARAQRSPDRDLAAARRGSRQE